MIFSSFKVVTVGGQSGAISPVGALSPGGEEVASGVGVSQEARMFNCSICIKKLQLYISFFIKHEKNELYLEMETLFFFILLLTLWFHFQQFGQQRKREIRLMKNREAARECRLTSFFILV